jgi:intein/homing endonuclease
MPEIDWRLIWLAGFVDGEGYIGITINNGVWQPRFFIASTHSPSMYEVGKLLREYNIKYGMYLIEANTVKHKDTVRIHIREKESIEKFLNLIYNYTLTKSLQCSLMLEFLKEKPKNSRGYSDRAKQIIAEIGQLNKTGQVREGL